MEYFWPFLIFCITMSVSPGPNNIMLMTSSMNFGIRPTLPSFCGVVVGMTFFSLAVAVGMGTVFLIYPWLKQVIQVTGAVYLLYLACQIATAHTKVNKKKMVKPLSFMQSFLFQWVNPKAWAGWLSAVSAYASNAGDRETLELVIMTGTRFFVILLSCGMWYLGGAALKKLLKNDKHQACFNYVMGALLALSVLPLFF